MAQAAQHTEREQQLGFFGRLRDAAGVRHVAPSASRSSVVARQGTWTRPARSRHTGMTNKPATPLCAGCRAKEARYGFRRHEDDPTTDRPRTLCFECFRGELAYRQAVTARLARGWNASQVALPLEATLNELTRRRRRAQIAARHALDALG